jgi:hypothetical protein
MSDALIQRQNSFKKANDYVNYTIDKINTWNTPAKYLIFALFPILAMIFIFLLYFAIMETYTVKKRGTQVLKTTFTWIGSIISIIIFLFFCYEFRDKIMLWIYILIGFIIKLLSDLWEYIKTHYFIFLITIVYLFSIGYIFYYLYYVFVYDKWLDEAKYVVPFVFSIVGLLGSIVFYFWRPDKDGDEPLKITSTTYILSFMASVFSLFVFCSLIYLDKIVSLRTFMGVILSICGISLFGNLDLQ